MSDGLGEDPLITCEDGFEGLDRQFNAWYVARATVKADDGGGTLHVLVGISAAERANKRTPEDQVLARAAALRNALVRAHREEARTLRGHKTIRAWWNDPAPATRPTRPSPSVAADVRS